MSNTVITNFRDASGPRSGADSPFVVVLERDGTISLDNAALEGLVGGDSSQSAGISVVRVGHDGRPDDATDSENEDDSVPHVTLTVDGYYDDPNGIAKYDSGIEMLQSLSNETREHSLIGFQNDHCYTPLTSPSQALPSQLTSEISYDELMIQPKATIPSSKKITILEQQIIPKGKKIVFNPTKAPVILKGTDALSKPLPGLANKQNKKQTAATQELSKKQEEAQSGSENTDSSSDSTSGESINDRDSDADYKYARDSLSKSKKPKSILRGVRKVIPKNYSNTKQSSKVVAKPPKPAKSLIRQEIKDNILHKKSKIQLVRKTQPSILSRKRPEPPVSASAVSSKAPEKPEQKPETHKPQKIAKKEKKTPAHVTALLSDMTSLFSAPDVIRRVSTEGKVKGDKSIQETETDNKDKTASKQPAALKTYGKSKERSSITDVKDMELIPQIDDASLAQLLQGPSTTEAAPGPGGASTTTANPLSSPNLGPLSPSLDLLEGLQPEEEGLTEDLLMHVAQLVESSENLQEVIDKQVLGKVDTGPPKTNALTALVNAQTYAQASAAAKMRQGGPRKDPIQIVRSDGRVITLPPIEAPATRSSKRKSLPTQQEQEAHPPVLLPIPTPEPVLISPTPKQYSNKKLAVKKPEPPLAVTTPLSKLMQESEDSMNSEDDPYRLWCICKQPHNNRFMICCDQCEDWFHGKCVNITKAMGQQMEEQGVEWTCPNCIKKTTPKPSAKGGGSRKSVEGPSRLSGDRMSGLRGSASVEAPRPSGGSMLGRGAEMGAGPRCIVCDKAARAGSIYCSDACILKHAQESLGANTSPGAPARPDGVERSESRIIVFERRTGRVLQGPNAPTAANLKTWLQEHPTFEVVRRERENKPMVNMKKTPLKAPQKIQTTLKFDKQQKQIILLQPQPRTPQGDSKPAKSIPHSPQDISPKTPLTPKPNVPRTPQLKQTLLTSKDNVLTSKQGTPLKQGPLTPKQGPPTPKLVPTSPKTPDGRTPGKITLVRSKSVAEKQPMKSPPTPVTRTRREKEPEPKPKPVSTGPIRENVKKALQEHMTVRLKETKGVKFTDEEIKKFAIDTELEMHNMFKEVSMKYKAKYRSLIFNIKDRKNLSLWKKICDRSLTPKQLVHMSPEELASQELAQWRDKEAKYQLELIKKSELDLLAANKTYVLKTHKGEEVMEQKSVAAELDPNVAMEDLVTALNDSTAGDEELADKDDKLKHSRQKESRRKSPHRDSPTRSSSRHKSKDSRNKSKKKSSKDRSVEEQRSRRERNRSRSHERTRDRSKQRDKKDSRSKSASKESSEKTRSRSRERSKLRSRSRGRSRTRRRSRSKSKSSKFRSISQERQPRSLSQENDYHSKDKYSSKEEPVERPKSAMQKESHPEYDPHEPMITSAFSEEDLRRSREASFDEGYTEEVDLGSKDEEYDPTKTLSFDVDPPAIAGSSRNERISSEVESDQEPSSTVDSAAPPVWNGLVNMVDVARFYVDAHQVSGNSSDLEDDLSSELEIVGRINPETVWDYISKMKRTSNKDILVLKLVSSAVATVEERMQYIALYSYLSSRNRLGVVKVTNTSVKDFYIFPLAATASLPSVLLPLEGPGLDDVRTHLLFALIVRQKKKRSASSKLDTLPSKVAKSSTRKRSYTPPVAGDSYTPPTSPSPAPSRRSAPLRLPLPFVQPTPALSTSVKDKIAASLASAEEDEAYSPGGSSSGSSVDDSLRSRVDEINRQIEEQKQQILNIATTVKQSQEDEAYSPSRPMTPPRAALADIALPSNLQEILATIQQRSAQPPTPQTQPPLPPPPPSDVDMRLPPPPPPAAGSLHSLSEEELLRMVPDNAQ